MEDKQIIRLFFARAEGAIQALADKFGVRLLATARNILGSHEDAEESVSDTYLAVWNAIPPRQPDPLAGFVYKTGRNLALKKLRSQTALRRDSRYDLSLDELSGCIAGASLEDEFDARVLGRAVDRFLNTLSRDNRALFLRRYWFGDSVKDIAAQYKMTENAVTLRLRRVRAQLREYLSKEGLIDG